MSVDPGTRAVGVIMAGGSGERMRQSGVRTNKPLVTVLGMSLVERNLAAMIRSGLTDVRVVVAGGPGGEDIARWAGGRGGALARAADARLTVVVETAPLGNCGGLALALGPDDGDAVLVFADNLTDLDLAAMLRVHVEGRAALTLAVHDEPFRLPYGLVDMEGDVVTGYREKPLVDVTVSSGLAVVSGSARALLAGPAGLADLANITVRHGLVVQPFRHQALWIDVNDSDKVEAATGLVRSAPDRFEQFWPGDILRTVDAPGSLVIDDVDAEGRPVRVEAAGARMEQLSPEGWSRVLAWRGGTTQRTRVRPDNGLVAGSDDAQ